jgi:cellulose synthase/poly-beta-1,6-N-acetylglucosamine synthase-like glycosyltransferase
MTDQPFVSVVIPALNCAPEVADCVAALRMQDYPADRFEILIVDNGSTDDTLERIRAVGVQALQRPERGRSRALNEGLKHAKGEIICTTDISCRPEPDWISAIVESFRDPSVGCVAGEIKMLPGPDNAAIRYQERANYMSAMSAMERHRPPYLPYADGANASFRKNVFDVIGPFEESFIKAADVEICYRILFLTHYKIAFNSRAVVWEPGEEDLRALLKQRYRIGIGNVLLQTRFPDLYKVLRQKTLRERYWSASAIGGKFLQILMLAFPSMLNRGSRERLNDLVISEAMKIAQRLGYREGIRQISAMSAPPLPIRQQVIDQYVSGGWSVSSRVVRAELRSS